VSLWRSTRGEDYAERPTRQAAHLKMDPLLKHGSLLHGSELLLRLARVGIFWSRSPRHENAHSLGCTRHPQGVAVAPWRRTHRGSRSRRTEHESRYTGVLPEKISQRVRPST